MTTHTHSHHHLFLLQRLLLLVICLSRSLAEPLLTPAPPLALPLNMAGVVAKEDLDALSSRKDTDGGAPGGPFVLRDPTYLVVAPRLVRAGQVYRAVVNILDPSPPLVVRATIFRDNIELAAVEHECESDYPHALELMVPQGVAGGRYRLKLEGNEIGSLTGSSFVNETELSFSPRGATVLVQTDKPIYKQEDVVRFRVVALDTAVKMVDDSVDVFILSPTGVMVRRWLSRQCREGPVALEFPLSAEPEYGRWTIRVEATNTFTQHLFSVEMFHTPRFEVEVQVPSFLTSDSAYLEGTVIANYTSGAPITGNVTVRAAVRPIGPLVYRQQDAAEPTVSQPHAMAPEGSRVSQELAVCYKKSHTFAGVFPFKFRVSDLEALVVRSSEGSEVRVTAMVGDAYWDTTHSGHATTRIFKSDIKLDFLGESPQVLRPAMPFKFYLSATQHDGSKVPEWRLLRHRLLVSPEVRLYTGEKRKLLSRTVKMTHARYALWESEIDVHDELSDLEASLMVESLRLDAELKDSMGSRSFASLVTVAHHSPRGHHLQVTTSTKAPKVGEYVILHVRSNYYLDKFRYILLSKGMVIEAGQQTMEATLKTFPLPLTPEVAGVATVVVYTVGRDENLVADALTFPVDALTRKGLHVGLKQDPRDSEKLRVTVTALPGSCVALAGTHWASYSMQAGNDLTHAKILYQMSRDSSKVVQEPLEQKWVSQNGLPENILHLPHTSPGIDPNATFTYADLLVLTDGPVPTIGDACGTAGGSKGQCLLGGCYSTIARCDGKFDCMDRVDEKGCHVPGALEENLAWYRQHRSSRLSRHYAPPWVWEEVTVGDSGSATLSVPIPHGSVHLALSAFSLHPEQGMTILSQPVQWKGSVGFWMSVEAPSRVGVWEQVGVRVTAVNHSPQRMNTVVVLANSPDYKFVDVKAFQQPHGDQSKERRMVSGEHEHSVWVEAGDTHTLYLPIVPIRLGEVRVLVQATLPSHKLQREIVVLVEPLGAVQEHHTSMLLDLSNRPYYFTFLDVNTSEGLVPGSDEAHVSVFGDTVGAVQLPTNPATPDRLLGLPTAGCEPVAFSFLLTVVQLHYWREMMQEPQLDEKEVFKELSLLYQTLLVYQNRDGGFKYFRTSERSSVWVTSLVLRALNEVAIAWPHLLYIDPQVTDKALKFVLSQQAPHGAWQEPSGEVVDRKLMPALYSLTGESTHALNLSSTAHTMLALLALKDLPSPLDEQVLTAISRGRSWLEENLPLVGQASRPLEVSMVALVLHLASSSRAGTAFEFLTRNARQEVRYMYWGEDLVPLPSYRVEFGRTHLQPRLPHRHDAGNVAATAYALRLYTLRGELMTPSIMRWLQSQRSHDGGWRSTQDSLAAWEALHEYSQREGTARDTRLTVTVEPLHDHTQARTFYILPDNFLTLQTQQVDGKWGSVRVKGQGRGSAVFQLTSRYHVAEPHHITSPPTPAFRLMTRAIWHGQNGSALTFATCVRWLFREGGDSSGVSVLEVTVPTGYGTSMEALHNLVTAGKVPNLRRADFTERRVTFFFEKLTGSKTCVEFSVERWYPVANLTKVLPVKVYEYYSPELFEIELLDMSSVSLDICQVCGSYQCPNCPILSYYSSSAPCTAPAQPWHLLLALLLCWAARMAPS